MSQQDSKCPYKDICPTIMYWCNEKHDYIANVCNTGEHVKCTHFMGLDVNPQWVQDARNRVKEI